MSSRRKWDELQRLELRELELRQPHRRQGTADEQPQHSPSTVPAGATAPARVGSTSGDVESANGAESGPRPGCLRQSTHWLGQLVNWLLCRLFVAAEQPPESTSPRSEELIGLALSGGGIRSATFNLGVLQELHSLGLLGAVHYLSTVSGGGYTGGFWSAWRTRNGNANRLFPHRDENGSEPKEIRHLREFSNFLQPRRGLLSVEAGRMAVSAAAAILPGVLISLAVLALALLAWLGVGWLLLTNPSDGMSPWPTQPWISILLVTLLIQTTLEGLWRWRRRERYREEFTATGALALSASLAATATAMAWALLWNVVPLPFEFLLRPLPTKELGLVAGTVLLPVAAWAAGVLLLILGRVLTSRCNSRWRDRMRRAALDRALGRTLLCIGGWAVLGLVWIVGQLFAEGGFASIATLAGTGGIAGGAYAWLRRFLGKQPHKPTGSRAKPRIGAWTMVVLAYVALAAVTTAVAALLIRISWTFGPLSLHWTALAATVVLALAILTFDPHENGFHAFYRARLARAYLGASNKSNKERHSEATFECEDDDRSLDELPKRPLHLVCCTANDLASDPLDTLHRGAKSAVLSPLALQVDEDWRTWEEAFPAPRLSSAMTASAAAFNSHMGHVSMRLGSAATFLLTALNLRLGLWMEHPSRPSSPNRRATFWRRLQRCLPGLLYLRELVGYSRSDSTWIHLSDGAHFENLGLYELVRRHCRCILLSDCCADPDAAFDDFGNAVRRIREDFGVEIEIDLAPLRPNDGGLARQPMVAGDIRYPSGDLGVLLYLKPTLTGNEPPDVAQYAQRNKDFPHESTLDQFYDEAQWEAYRRLGEHVTERALRKLADRLREELDCATDAHEDSSQETLRQFENREAIRLFLHARYAWPPGGADDPALAVAIDREWTELENRLEDPTFAALRRQLVPQNEQTADPSDEDHIQALPAIRDALRLMETVILHLGINATPTAQNHPLYMGWLNRLGQWATARSFRAWWQWLAPLHSPEAIEFLIATFDLPPVAGTESSSQIKKIDQTVHSEFTWKRWEVHRDRQAERPSGPTSTDKAEAPELLGFFLPTEIPGISLLLPKTVETEAAVRAGRERRPQEPHLLAGIVEFARLETDRGPCASWTPELFFVPPGLWGVRVGERFLDKLIDRLKDQGFERIEVRIPAARGDATMVRDALYIGAGFRREDRGEGEGKERFLVLDLRDTHSTARTK